MIRVGLTGGICTGKTTVARMFRKLGAPVISADTVVHSLLKKNNSIKNKLIKTFGKEIVSNAGDISRQQLADTVFHDEKKLKRLTAILYPEVRNTIQKKFSDYEKANRYPVTVAEVPMLIEGGALHLYDVIIVVTASYENQLKRSLKKGGISKKNLNDRIKHQMDLREKIKYADYVIDNDGAKVTTLEQVKKIWSILVNKK